jgi:hypothetical protein
MPYAPGTYDRVLRMSQSIAKKFQFSVAPFSGSRIRRLFTYITAFFRPMSPELFSKSLSNLGYTRVLVQNRDTWAAREPDLRLFLLQGRRPQIFRHSPLKVAGLVSAPGGGSVGLSHSCRNAPAPQC